MTKATHLAEDIAQRASQLQHDLDNQEAKRPAFLDIREMRRELNTLEQELRDEADSAVGDAC